MDPTIRVKTPLDVRLARLKKCKSPSPEFSFWLMEKASETSVIDSLRSNNAEAEAAALQQVCSRQFRKNPRSITFGDLAVLLTSWYMGNNDNNDEFFIYLISFIRFLEKNISVSLTTHYRRSSKMELNAGELNYMEEMLQIPIIDYMQKVMELGMPAQSKEWFADYYNVSRFDEYTDLRTFLKEILDDLKYKDGTLNSESLVKLVADGKRLSDLPRKIFQPLMNTIAIPIAFIAIESLEIGQED
ncbi:MAG: hypothetical protein IJH43_09995 [Mogibacterium sp.]|nr:hypothetical protein [Mogibacterium sp.]